MCYECNQTYLMKCSLFLQQQKKIHGNNTFSYEEAFFTVRIEKMRLFDGFFTFNVLDDSIW